MVKFRLNGRPREMDANPDMPLLWVLHDELKMTGTKFGCGVASCGACTVHIDGEATRSCQTLIGDLEGADVTTIEALERWLTRVPGGLVVSNLGACALFSAMSGSSPATCAAIGKMGIPEMRKRGYPDAVAAGSIAAGGTLGILIPPRSR